MKLSDIKGERTLELMSDLIEPVTSIASDKKVSSLLVRSNDEDEVKDGLKNVAREVLRSHRSDVIEILAALEGVDAKEYAETLTPMKLVRTLMEIVNDSELVSFFTQLSEAGDGSIGGSEPTLALG